jgi:hypothetical protein
VFGSAATDLKIDPMLSKRALVAHLESWYPLLLCPMVNFELNPKKVLGDFHYFF